MKKLSQLLASLTNLSDPITELERAHTVLEAAHAAAVAELDGFAHARKKALEDDDDAALGSLRLRRPFLEDERDRLVIAIEAVRQKLAEAHAAKKQARVAELRAAHDTAIHAYLAATQPALSAFEAVLKVRAEGIREGFANAIAAMELPPTVGPSAILSREALEAYARNVADALPRPKRAPSKPKPVAIKASLPEPRVVLPVAARRAPIRETPKQGETLVVALRPGAEVSGRGPLAIGDEIALSHDAATNLLRAGVVEFVSVASPPIIDANQQESIS
jgi:hypothetical protein